MSNVWYCRFCHQKIDDEFYCSPECESSDRDFNSWVERAMTGEEHERMVQASNVEWNAAIKDGLFK